MHILLMRKINFLGKVAKNFNLFLFFLRQGRIPSPSYRPRPRPNLPSRTSRHHRRRRVNRSRRRCVYPARYWLHSAAEGRADSIGVHSQVEEAARDPEEATRPTEVLDRQPQGGGARGGPRGGHQGRWGRW